MQLRARTNETKRFPSWTHPPGPSATAVAPRRAAPPQAPRRAAPAVMRTVPTIGPDLRRLEGYFCLSAVTMPYSNEDINKARGTARDYRENICCQIDLGVSAVGVARAGDVSLQAAARRALRKGCQGDLDLPGPGEGLWMGHESLIQM